jgi:uncharacterized membrane protein YphA (DoxX/SURF4 family)
MSESILTVDGAAGRSGTLATVAVWIARVAVALILGMGALTKFFMYTPDGSMALAEAMGVGRGIILAIGLVELTAATLILVPRLQLIGGLLAAGTMAGALFTHATKIGWSGNAAAEMWPLALVAFAAASFVVVLRYLKR